MRVVNRAHRLVRDLEQRVDGAQRLQPLLPARLLEAGGEVFGALPCQGRLVGVEGRPPAVGGDVVDQGVERCHVRREEQHLGDRRQLGLEALLSRLLPEGVEVGRQGDVGEKLGAAGLELVDHPAEVGGAVGVGAAVEGLVA